MRCDVCGFDEALFPNGAELHAHFHDEAERQIDEMTPELARCLDEEIRAQLIEMDVTYTRERIGNLLKYQSAFLQMAEEVDADTDAVNKLHGLEMRDLLQRISEETDATILTLTLEECYAVLDVMMSVESEFGGLDDDAQQVKDRIHHTLTELGLPLSPVLPPSRLLDDKLDF